VSDDLHASAQPQHSDREKYQTRTHSLKSTKPCVGGPVYRVHQPLIVAEGQAIVMVSEKSRLRVRREKALVDCG
jgi:hypothetical protein